MDVPDILRYFDAEGGIADFTGLSDDIRLFWQLPIRYLSDALTPARLARDRPEEEFPSYVAFVRNGSFNAAIRHEESCAGAGIFAGVPMVALQACRLFALRMDLSSGLPLRDSRERLIIFPDRLQLPTEWITPEEPSRQALEDVLCFEENTDTHNNELALLMFDIAMRYVAMHECMHFVLGHARFCQIALGLDIFKDGTERRRQIDGITSQTLEFIADRHVIRGLADDLTYGRLFHEWSRTVPDEVAVPHKVWYRRVLFTTLALISRLWTVHGAQTFADFTQPYPHPYERICWMTSGLIEMEGPTLGQDAMLAFALATGSLDRNFETARQDIPLITRDMEIQDLIGFSALDHGYSVVRGRAIEIQKKLHESYGPFYPPDEDAERLQQPGETNCG